MALPSRPRHRRATSAGRIRDFTIYGAASGAVFGEGSRFRIHQRNVITIKVGGVDGELMARGKRARESQTAKGRSRFIGKQESR